MNVPPGVCIKVKGDILPDAELFRINIGKDELNIGLHFNPRFNYLGDYNTIVCNSRKEGQWGKEQREKVFPFVPGTKVEVFITFNEGHFKLRMHDGYEFTFPNRLNLKKLDYLSMYGDFNVEKVDFE
ncbi:galectin-1-like isoform X2 [Petaurus breviceps papuanus]